MVVIVKIVIILLIGIVASLLVVAFGSLKNNSESNSTYDKMSFRETMDLCELPIVTFTNNGIKLNFLLDTGCSTSVIHKEVLDNLDYTDSNMVGEIYGMEGNKQSTFYINMNISYKDKDYEESFQVVDMSAPFGHLKAEHGVNLHGILSSSFFEKYKYVLNYDELVAYSKA